MNVCEYDIILFTETSLHEDIFDNELGIPDYVIYRSDRRPATSEHQRLGGAMIAVHRSISSKVMDTFTDNLESIFVQIYTIKQKILIGCIYLPPQSDLNLYSDYINSVEFILENHNFTDIYLCGDFNLPKISWINDKFGSSAHGAIDDRVECITDGLAYFNLFQVNQIQNCMGGFLDLVFTDNVHCGVGVADVPLLSCDKYHPALIFDIFCDHSFKALDFDYFYYDYKNANYILINEYLAGFNWDILLDLNDINNSLDIFYSILNYCIEIFVPKRRCKNPKFPTWYSSELKQLIFQKKAAHRRFKQMGSHSDYSIFSNLRRKCKDLYIKNYKDYIENIQENIKNKKQFWNYVNHKYKNFDLPNAMSFNDISSDDPNEIVNLFAKFFNEVYTDRVVNVSNLLSTGKFECVNTCIFSSIDVLECLCNLNLRLSCGPDEISAVFVYNCRFVLTPVLHSIYTLSLRSGVFPERWKVSYITPVFKNGKRSDIKNYRAISKMPIFAKIFDSLVATKLGASFNKLLTEQQHGFVSGRSVVTNLLTYEEYLLDALEGGYQVDVIYTDFSKAFDSVNHQALCFKMSGIGLHGVFLTWLESYLSNRLQIVKINNHLSFAINVTSGVPQGGHISPLLFNCFINDICNCFINCKFLLYADDLKIFRKISSIADCTLLQADVTRLFNWCNENGLELNINKCKIMRFFRKKQRIIFDYKIDTEHLENLQTVKDLGVHFDPVLSFKDHYNFIVNRALKLLGFMKRSLSEFDNVRCFKDIFCSLVRSILEYATIIWSPYYKCHKDLIEKVQQKFLRFVAYKLGIPLEDINYNQISTLLGLPTLENRRVLLDLIFLFKLVTGFVDSPELLYRIKFHVPPRTTRSQIQFHVEYHQTNYALNGPIQRCCRSANEYCDMDVFVSSINAFKKHLLKRLT